MLGTVIQLFILATVQLFLAKPAGQLVFVSRLVEHTLCLEQIYNCLLQPLYTCTWTNLWVTFSGQTRGWSESTLILANESPSRITRLIHVKQSQASKLVTEDRDGQTERVTYRALGSRRSQKHAHFLGMKYL
jgi:hypothetical protein